MAEKVICNPKQLKHCWKAIITLVEHLPPQTDICLWTFCHSTVHTNTCEMPRHSPVCACMQSTLGHHCLPSQYLNLTEPEFATSMDRKSIDVLISSQKRKKNKYIVKVMWNPSVNLLILFWASIGWLNCNFSALLTLLRSFGAGQFTYQHFSWACLIL